MPVTTESGLLNNIELSQTIEEFGEKGPSQSRIDLNQPYIIRDAFCDSPVFNKWSDDYLMAQVGDQKVNVYVSLDGSFPGGQSSYDKGNYQLFEMCFSEFLERLNSNKHQPILAAHEKYYLYQSPAENHSSLLADLATPAQLPSDEHQHCIRALWISSAGNKTPPHWDSYDNVMMQIRGKKRFILWEPKHYENLYIRPLGQQHDRQSPVDINNPDLARYPDYKNARPLECVLEPGDTLYIPLGWMHFVETMDFSISVSNWWLPNEIKMLVQGDNLGTASYSNKDQSMMQLATDSIRSVCANTRPELVDLFEAMCRDGSVLDLDKLRL